MKMKLGAVMLAVVIASGCSTQSTTPDTEKGQFQLYISDQPADIDDFDHLNVTVSQVRVFSQQENSTNNSSSSFTEFNITETVDLTQLKGDNASAILTEELDAGNYSKLELEASSIDAEVNGSEVEVKLPSGKLQLTKGFTVAPNETTEFVFDIQVALRGNQQNNQGYILRPVISQSGTVGEDVEINRKQGSTGNSSQRPESRPSEGSETDGSSNGSAGEAERAPGPANIPA